jgi:hypothetical protein
MEWYVLDSFREPFVSFHGIFSFVHSLSLFSFSLQLLVFSVTFPFCEISFFSLADFSNSLRVFLHYVMTVLDHLQAASNNSKVVTAASTATLSLSSISVIIIVSIWNLFELKS